MGCEATIRRVRLAKPGPPEVLEIEEVSRPEPGPGEVRIRVDAAGVNFTDVLIRMGVFAEMPELPIVPGFEVAGAVEALGPEVDPAWLGREVLGLCSYGGYAEAVVLPLGRVHERPARMSAIEGAAIPVNYLTAYLLVVRMGSLHADETVLVHSAGGGVGVAAVQLAHSVGARVIATASGHKHDFLKSLGVDACIDYTSEDFTEAVLELTGGEGVELVIDPLGGESFAKGCKVLAPTGRLGMYGMASIQMGKARNWWSSLRAAYKPWVRFTPPGLMRATKGVFGVDMSRLWGQEKRIRAWLGRLLELYEAGEIQPVIAAEMPLECAAEGQHLLEKRLNLGKVVLLP